MKISIGQLRRIIREQLAVTGMFTGPERMEREPMLKVGGNVDDGDGEELAPHLREPVVDPEDCVGPVPPTGMEPYATSDPLARFWAQ